jgi:hypothetical protein
MNVNQGVRGAKVDAHILSEATKKSGKHENGSLRPKLLDADTKLAKHSGQLK